MKKLLVFVMAMTLCCIGNARKIGAPDIRMKYMQKTEADAGANSFEVTGAYLFNLGQRFHLGAGFGLGTANPVIWENPNRDEYVKEQTLTVPFFIRGKFDFRGQNNRPFLSATACERWAVVDYNNEDFNPMGFSFNFAFGYEWRVGSHWIGGEVGFEPMCGKYVNTFYPGYEKEVSLDISFAIHFTF